MHYLRNKILYLVPASFISVRGLWINMYKLYGFAWGHLKSSMNVILDYLVCEDNYKVLNISFKQTGVLALLVSLKLVVFHKIDRTLLSLSIISFSLKWYFLFSSWLNSAKAVISMYSFFHALEQSTLHSSLSSILFCNCWKLGPGRYSGCLKGFYVVR